MTAEHAETRRALAARALAASAALLAVRYGAPPEASADQAAVTVPTVPATTTTAGPPPETTVLGAVLISELASVFAYQHLLATAPLTRGAKIVIRGFLEHERAHAATIDAALSARGGFGSDALHSLAYADQVLQALGAPGRIVQIKSQLDALKFLIGVETVEEGVYYQAIAAVTDPELLTSLTQIMANEAQHELGLRIVAGETMPSDYAPGAFVEGRHPPLR